MAGRSTSRWSSTGCSPTGWKRDLASLADRDGLGTLLRMAHPTVDHYMPALTIAGASNAQDRLTFMTDAIDLGSVSMRSFVFHA